MDMNKQKKRTPPRWFYFAIGIGSLMASGIYIGIGKTAGFSSGRVIPAVIFGVLGLLWVLMYGEDAGRSRSCGEG
jgi:hypothetical protein